MNHYRGRRDAIAALVLDDRVHRDLYLSDEIFALEQEHFFANTWNYLGHASQVPNADDYLSVDIAGRPLLMVRQAGGEIRVMGLRADGNEWVSLHPGVDEGSFP